MPPRELIGKQHEGAYFCDRWELRITQRCLAADLGAAGAEFRQVRQKTIVRAFVRERFEKATGGRQVSQLSKGREVWVLAHQHDHRGGTWYDEMYGVIWLVSYRRHRSGESDDFFPYTRGLEKSDDLYPTEEDYRLLFDERGDRFAYVVPIQAPALLKVARQNPGEEIKGMLGDRYNAAVAIEVEPDIEATTVALRPQSVDLFEELAVILGSFHADEDWEQVYEMPSRPLEEDEIAFRHHHEP